MSRGAREMVLDARIGKRLDAFAAGRENPASADTRLPSSPPPSPLLLLLLLSLSPAYVTPGPHDFHWNRGLITIGTVSRGDLKVHSRGSP